MAPLISSPTVNDLVEPLGIDSPAPVLSWKVQDGVQDRYAIEVATDPGFAGSGILWRSGWVDDPAPFGHAYGGPPLASATRYWWRVQVGSVEEVSEWSPPSVFETGLLEEDDWIAHWITDPVTESPRTLYFRSDLELPSPTLRARAYVSALGWYKLWINGVNVTDQALVPRFTPFDAYVEYQTYDVTDLLREGANAIGVVVSEGRFRGRLGAFSKPERFGDRLAAIAQIAVELGNGERLVVGSDSSWTVGTGRIVSADPKFGERVDLRIDGMQWLGPGSGPENERSAVPLATHPRRLIAEEVERVTQVGTLRGTVSQTPAGDQLVDFGQNFNGHARILLTGPAGSKAVLRYSEVLTRDGELNTDYLHFPGSSKDDEWFQRDEVVLDGTARVYETSFAVRGFRYLSVEGSTHLLTDQDVEAVVVSTDLERTGHFDCSDPRLVQLWRNSWWSMSSNFADTPTDCPTRERSGWTGDIQIFGPAASILARTDAYLRRYLRNLAADQFHDGTIPPVIPSEAPGSLGEKDRLQEMARTSVGWGDVSVMLPWTLHRYFGDLQVLENQYDSAKEWVRFLERRGCKRGVSRRLGRRLGPLEDFIIDTGFNWGEWLRPGETAASQMAGNLLTGRPEVATAYFANSARLLSGIADILGHDDDREHFADVADSAKEAYNLAFVRRRGTRIGADRQDDYVRALAFDLLPQTARAAATDRLVELIETAGDHLDTGFLSTALLLPALCDNGREDVAWRVLLNPTSPSWMAQIAQGATTIWETWEGHDKKGNPADSHNHYAFGSVTQWLHEYVAGVRPLEPGYRRFLVSPTFGELTFAETSLATGYGTIVSRWERSEGRILLRLSVPLGTEAEVEIGGMREALSGGVHNLSWSEDDSTVPARSSALRSD
ncbi:family 78 glycoside hydrolase catalytic domain [Microbacteriaceae bacterium VKM Ac-2855]|nr:family 78 glycoside hydrolase catalytic domain [Microbacteriaceae bacterium VKM Ac-2855]